MPLFFFLLLVEMWIELNDYVWFLENLRENAKKKIERKSIRKKKKIQN